MSRNFDSFRARLENPAGAVRKGMRMSALYIRRRVHSNLNRILCRYTAEEMSKANDCHY